MKNSIGIHALVWSGNWNLKDIENSIKLSKQLGYDLIEIPLLIHLILILQKYLINTNSIL